MKSFLSLARLASLSLLLLASSHQLAAQIKPPIDPGDLGQSGLGPVAVIGWADGRWLTATAERGVSGLVGVQPGEIVTVQLSFPLTLAGQRFVAESLDGGALTADQPLSVINPDGTVNLTFKAGALPGLNRVAVQTGGQISLLRFWVLDPTNRTSHPALLSPAQ